MLFLISWKNFLKRVFQEIRNKEEVDQKGKGIITIQKIKVIQFNLKELDVDGSKIENRLFII